MRESDNANQKERERGERSAAQHRRVHVGLPRLRVVGQLDRRVYQDGTGGQRAVCVRERGGGHVRDEEQTMDGQCEHALCEVPSLDVRKGYKTHLVDHDSRRRK